MKSTKCLPSMKQSLIPFIAMILFFGVGKTYFNYPLEILMLASAAISCGLAFYLGHDWKSIQDKIAEKFSQAMPAIIILQVIGFLIGAWMISGTIPLMIKMGLTMINPQYLFVSAFVATAMLSVFTGTSWGSAGTLGVALMGVAAAQDISLPITAGAVISGAYFGDKMSPLSDSCNITAVAAKTDIFKHIQNMTWTAVPSAIICLVVYTVLGFNTEVAYSGLSPEAESLLKEINSVFTLNTPTQWNNLIVIPFILIIAFDFFKKILSINFEHSITKLLFQALIIIVAAFSILKSVTSEFNMVLLLPILVILYGSVNKKPTAVLMVGAATLSGILALIYQQFNINDVMNTMVSGFKLDMVNEIDRSSFSWAASRLLERGGLYSLVSATIILLCAFTIAAGLEVSGAMKKIIDALIEKTNTVFKLISATMITGATLVAATSNGSAASLITGDAFSKPFKDKKLSAVNLSRTLEDSIIITEPLMFFTVSGIYMSQTLGVTVSEYLPWTFFCITGIFLSLMWAWLHDRGLCHLKPIDDSETFNSKNEDSIDSAMVIK